ncbi:hypothetical protein OG921_04890 [Aldersonia sp. NBC_00410]|uniref:hypothetical protein n=1 Tax=Aldersonia sp. NBC_00410 TaxID=2975954 RepID=UPI002258A687|nr:hypothetical protein [Aldersonia sp. NBC_00410]MCX5042508.1 hypothetical protein [Aldersonia sp. NBC_00410]
MNSREDTAAGIEGSGGRFAGHPPQLDPDAPPPDSDWTGWLASEVDVVGAHDAIGDDLAFTNDEPDAQDRMAELSASLVERREQRLARKRRARLVSVGVAGVFVAGGVVLALTVTRGTDETSAAPTGLVPAVTSPTESVRPSAVPAAWCPTVQEGAHVSGSGAGDLTSGPGIVLALQHRMYVDRDSDGVRALFAPGAVVAPVEDTRAAIATIPAGTEHCVNIIALAPDRFAVTVDELHPDRTTQRWETTVTTATGPDSRPAIIAVAPANVGGQ